MRKDLSTLTLDLPVLDLTSDSFHNPGNPMLTKMLKRMSEHEVGEFCSTLLTSIIRESKARQEAMGERTARAMKTRSADDLTFEPAPNSRWFLCTARSLLARCPADDAAEECIALGACARGRQR